MITIYAKLDNEKIKSCIAEILYPFFSKCYNSVFPNLNIAATVKRRNELMKELHPEITFSEYNDYVLIIADWGESVIAEMIASVDTINNFPKTYQSKAKYFVKSIRWDAKFSLTHN